jgi:hypothetical protein
VSHAELVEHVRAGLDRLFGDAGGCHDAEDAEDVIALVDYEGALDRIAYLEGVLKDIRDAIAPAVSE